MFNWCLVLLMLFVSLSSQMSSDLDCPIPRINHGRVRFRQRARMVKFLCLAHYELIGNKYASCRNGQWDEQLPVCVRGGCTIPQVENGVTLQMRESAWLVFMCYPGYERVGSISIHCDGRHWNATAPRCVSTKTPPPTSCDFETPDLCGWVQDERHDFDWTRLNKQTPSSILKTGPKYDHTLGRGKSGYYMYIESTARTTNESARLLSPLYDQSLSQNGCFRFYYHMYGLNMGGLRVYQKPNSLPLQTMTMLSTEELQKYILFEKWNNQGDYWYVNVSMLNDYSEGFQIVIEGIRGKSFTSDIAIDDVAILQGEACTKAIKESIQPTETCNDRCNVPETSGGSEACRCVIFCVLDGDCCPDFMDICGFPNDETTTDITNLEESPENAPQTQKLVRTTSVAIFSKTPTNITSRTVPITTTQSTTLKTTTVKATKATTTTTLKPTSLLTTKQPKATQTAKNTVKTTPKLVFKSSTPIYNATGILMKDKTTILMNTTTQKPATTAKLETTVILDHGISRTYENHNQYHELVKNEITNGNRNIANKNESSGVKTTLLTLGILLCITGAVFMVIVSRTSYGLATIARMRGRVSSDSEVRYLTANHDDE